MNHSHMVGGCGDCGPASGQMDDCSGQSECRWEEPMFGLVELGCVTALCVLLMLLGMLGNVLTMLVVWLRPHMRSATYLYLSSMAASDLLILLLLPLDLHKLYRPRPWHLGDFLCKLSVFLSECCTFSSLLHITLLSLERYVAICWPVAAKTLLSRSRTKALIGCLWVGAGLSAAPVLAMVGVEDVGGEGGGGEDRRECRCSDYAVSSGLLAAMTVLSNLYFLLPLGILGVVYSLIGRALWLRPPSSHRDQSSRRTVRMLGVIVLVFILCWLPFHVGRTLFSISLGAVDDTSMHAPLDAHVVTDTWSNTTHTGGHNATHGPAPPSRRAVLLYYLTQYFNLAASVLFYLSAAVNPLLYNLMSARYRRAVRSLVCTGSRTGARTGSLSGSGRRTPATMRHLASAV